MRLLTMPYILKKLVFEHLSMQQLVFLSLCSKNTKSLIEYTQKYRFKKIERVTYRINGNPMEINLKISSVKSPEKFMFFFKTPVDFINKVAGCEAVEEVQVSELGRSMVFFRSLTNPSDLHAKYSHHNVESIIETIHNHLYDVLGRWAEFRMWSVDGGTQYLPMLRNIHKLGLWGGAFATKRIDEFLSRSTCLEYFVWNAPHQKRRNFEKNSKIYELHTVDAWYGHSMGRDLMRYFNGRHVFLDCNNITENDIIKFLNAWKSGEKFRNLEVIHMTNCFHVATIRRSVELKELNTKVFYSFIRKERICDDPRIVPSDFESNTYMVRDSDDHVASVMLTGGQMFMGVWNLTEKEFLEKFQ